MKIYIVSSLLLALTMANPLDLSKPFEPVPFNPIPFDYIPEETTSLTFFDVEDRANPCMETVFGKRMSGVDKPNPVRMTLGRCKEICTEPFSSCKGFEHFGLNPSGVHDDNSEGLCRLFFGEVGTLDSSRGSNYASGIKGQC